MSATAVAPAHPWQRSLRTALQVLVGLAAMLPLLVDTAGLDETLPPVAGVLGIAAALSRIMALPAVEVFLRRFAPWLSAGDVPAGLVFMTEHAGGEVRAGDAHPAQTGTVLLPRGANGRFISPHRDNLEEPPA